MFWARGLRFFYCPFKECCHSLYAQRALLPSAEVRHYLHPLPARGHDAVKDASTRTISKPSNLSLTRPHRSPDNGRPVSAVDNDPTAPLSAIQVFALAPLAAAEALLLPWL